MLAFLFPGQGSQVPGMGKSLYESCDVARSILDRCNRVASGELLPLCFEGNADGLKPTAVAQPALFAVSMAVYSSLLSRGVTPSFVAGHSVGEYAALCAAGVFSLEDGMHLVQQRGAAMALAAEETQGGMAAVLGLDMDRVSEVCRQSGCPVVAANDNCPGQVVISGAAVDLDQVAKVLLEAGAKKVIRLAVSGGFHSPLMQSAVLTMSEVLAGVDFDTPRLRFVANVSADWISDPAAIKASLVEQITGPVRWTETLNRLHEAGAERFVECGSGTVIAGLVKRTLTGAKVASVGDISSLNQFLEVLC